MPSVEVAVSKLEAGDHIAYGQMYMRIAGDRRCPSCSMKYSNSDSLEEAERAVSRPFVRSTSSPFGAGTAKGWKPKRVSQHDTTQRSVVVRPKQNVSAKHKRIAVGREPKTQSLLRTEVLNACQLAITGGGQQIRGW